MGKLIADWGIFIFFVVICIILTFKDIQDAKEKH